MGLRFQKRIRIFKGLTLNLSKTGSSVTVGGRGASLNFRKGKVTQTLGIPGTGLSYRRRLDTNQAETQHKAEQLNTSNGSDSIGDANSNIWKVLAIVFLIAFIMTLSTLLTK